MKSRLLFFALLLLASCSRSPSEKEPDSKTQKAPATATSASRSFRFRALSRIVAIGDIHGDLAAMKRALRLGGAIDDSFRWTGGNLIVVQTGDQLDRGDQDREVIDELERLDQEARKQGGAVYAINGNHEMMNVQGNFQYVAPASLASFQEYARGTEKTKLSTYDPAARGRAAALLPGGPYAQKFAARFVALVVNDSVFVHGGILPSHAEYGLDRINDETSAWMRGQGSPPPIVVARDSPLWTRVYSQGEADPSTCKQAEDALFRLDAKRMIMGHTPQKDGISSACNQRVWRIDVGLSAHYGGPTEVLEINGQDVKVLK